MMQKMAGGHIEIERIWKTVEQGTSLTEEDGLTVALTPALAVAVAASARLV